MATADSPTTADGSTPLRSWRLVAVGAWAGLLAGLAEGALLAATRHVPTILSPHKAPLDVVWIAPLANAIVFAAASAGLSLIGTLWRRRLGSRFDTLIVGSALFGMLAIPLITLEVLFLPSALLLALGAAVLLTRRFGSRIVSATGMLAQRLLVLPLVVAVLSLITTGVTRYAEWRVAGALPAAAVGAKNVLILVLDTVRRDRFARDVRSMLAPTIDSLHDVGTWYRQAWSTSSWSLPSQASLLTGRYPHEHGADWPGIGLRSEVPTLPEVLAEHGYATGAFSGNSSWVVPEHLGRGFARFEAYRAIDVVQRLAGYRAVKPILMAMGVHDSGYGRQAPSLRSALARFIDDYHGRPFFAYVCLMDVNQALHRRRLSHPAWEDDPDADQVRAAYDSSLRVVDGEIAGILADLRTRGVLDNTLIVITSDHGESFGAEGTRDHDPEGHGSSLYPEQTRVPLLVILSKANQRAEIVDVPVSIRALASTVLEALGFPDATRFGRGLPIHGAATEAAAPAAASAVLLTLRYADVHEDALVEGTSFLLRRAADRGQESRLYDIARDPFATRELDDEEKVQEMQQRLDSLLGASSVP
ncbi:MAG: hypothetical protein ABS52_19200 [Gemmatimonadetes bacterium SCN 70-22]|nr:MAG: hypothetical protein ABS52_19200 [Gemmatimonadetes bacterium SCN 70-22]